MESGNNSNQILPEEEISLLKKEIEVLMKNKITEEERLKLAIFDRIPFTIWAADRDFKIIFWNKVCEDVYGITKKAALGANYLKLIVSPLEEEDSAKDCLDIIDNDKFFRNFLASDHNVVGKRLRMLTNCFRVPNSDESDYFQVEVASDITELDESLHRYRNLVEFAEARKQEEKKYFQLLQANLFDDLSSIYHDKKSAVNTEEQEISALIKTIESKNLNAKTVTEKYDKDRKEIADRKRSIESTNRCFRNEIIEAYDKECLEKTKKKIDDWEKIK